MFNIYVTPQTNHLMNFRFYQVKLLTRRLLKILQLRILLSPNSIKVRFTKQHSCNYRTSCWQMAEKLLQILCIFSCNYPVTKPENLKNKVPELAPIHLLSQTTSNVASEVTCSSPYLVAHLAKKQGIKQQDGI